jgi:PAS domain-containing protein
MIFDRLRRAAPRLRAALKTFVRELANDPADVVRQPEIGRDRFALAAKLSHVHCYRFELVDGDLANAKASFVNVWESLGYVTPPVAASFQEAFAMVVLPEDQARAGRDVLAALSGETPTFLSEYRIRHADGSIHWNLARGIVLRDGDGNPTELLGTAIDITDLKQVQEDARRVRERMELAVVGSKTCVWDAELDAVDFLDSKIQFTNVAEILGYEPASHPQTWRDGLFVFPEEDREAFSHGFAALLASDQRTWETTMRVIHRDRTVMTFLFRGVITRDSSGRATRLTGISMDITEYDKLAEELARTKARLELGLRSSGLGLFDVRLATATTPEVQTLLNVYEPLGYESGANAAIIYDEDRPTLAAHREQWLASTDGLYEIELRHRHRDGSERWKLSRGMMIRNAEGTPERHGAPARGHPRARGAGHARPAVVARAEDPEAHGAVPTEGAQPGRLPGPPHREQPDPARVDAEDPEERQQGEGVPLAGGRREARQLRKGRPGPPHRLRGYDP